MSKEKQLKITLDDWLALNECYYPISEYSIDKGCFPHGLSDREKKDMLKQFETNALKYYAKRKKMRKLFCSFVEKGIITPLTTFEDNICKCASNPELDSTKAAKRILWKKINKFPKDKLKCIIDIDALYNEFGTNLDSLTIDITNKSLIDNERIVYKEKECCLISTSNDEGLCIFGNNSTFSLTYKEMLVSIYGDSIERAKNLIKSIE